MNESEKRIIVADSDSVHCVDIQSGEVVWSQKLVGFMSGSIETVSLLEDRVIVGIGTVLACFNFSSGEELWRTEMPGTGFGRSIITNEICVNNRTIARVG